MLAATQTDELDRGASSPSVHRHCALTRELKPIDELIRFVVEPGSHVVPDVNRKLPGRGLWITGTRASVAEAVKRNVFARGFKQEVRVSADLAGTAELMLERAVLDALAIAGKAGLVAAGSGKAEDALQRDELVALIHAADAAAGGTRKLNAALQRKMQAKPREIAIIDLFSGGQLDLALNRPNVVHAALLAGPGSETFLARAMRLARFRTGQSTDTGGTHAPTDGARGHSTE